MKKYGKKAAAILLICVGIVELLCGICDKRFSTILLGGLFCLIGILHLAEIKGKNKSEEKEKQC